MILVVLAILMVIMIASTLVSRLADSSREVALATARLLIAQNALEAYAASARRLPCPANPALDTGVEEPLNGVTCTSGDGTVPWKTIGMRRDEAIDPWGRKLSYRVFDGATGLTQSNGLSMVDCDLVEATPAGRTANGLCQPTHDTVPGTYDPVSRKYSPNTSFLADKGRTIVDMGTQYDDVAYVILSHGETGLGGYTAASGNQVIPGPKSNEEKNNLKATGDFTIKPHSDYDTEANNSQHFDDILVYRRLPDLIHRIGLGARDWLDEGTTSLRFDRTSVSTAVGSTVMPGSSTGQSTINFGGNARVSGLGGGTTPTNISLDTSLDGTDGLGVAGGASNLLDSVSNESLQIRFYLGGRSLGLSLSNVGTYTDASGSFGEVAQVTFYLDDVKVAGPIYAGCGDPGPRGDFSIDIGGMLFNRVDITPLPAINLSTFARTGVSSFLVSEVKACDSGSPCKTSFDDGSRSPPICDTRTTLP
jgi:hypothetical protein